MTSSYHDDLDKIIRNYKGSPLALKEKQAIAACANYVWRAIRQLDAVDNEPLVDTWVEELIEFRYSILSMVGPSDSEAQIAAVRAAIVEDQRVEHQNEKLESQADEILDQAPEKVSNIGLPVVTHHSPVAHEQPWMMW